MGLDDCIGCREYQEMSRRRFMATTGAGIAAASLPAWIPQVVMAQDYCSTRDVIVSIFLRGAADGLTLCVPHQDSFYYTNRPTLAVPPPGGGPGACSDLNGFFGLPPAMSALIPAYLAGHLVVVHATGSMNPTRSHFDAQRYMEIGRPGDNFLATGWLGRHLASIAPMRPGSLLRGVCLSEGLERTLAGAPYALAVRDLADFSLDGGALSEIERLNVLQSLYALETGTLQQVAQSTRATYDLLHSINFNGYQPGGGALYPTNGLGYSMKTMAALLKADVGVEAIHLDVDGWDTHVNQGPVTGAMASLMTSFSQALAAFHADMFAGTGRAFVVVVHSEFGRKVQENGSLGTDHGHGNAMFVMGSGIAGGKVVSQWPGLAPELLFDGRDLEVTIDYRDVLAEIVSRRLGNNNLSQVFPGYSPTFRGVTASCLPGDLNCDGVVNAADAAAMGQLLVDPIAYQAGHPNCNMMRADFDGNGQVNGRDVQGFVQTLVP